MVTDQHWATGEQIEHSTQHNSWQKVSILYNGRPFPLKLPLFMGIWTPPNSWFFGPVWATIQTASQLVQLFLHRWPRTQSVPILYNGLPLSLNIAFSHGRSGPYLIHPWFPGPTWVLNPNSISIGWAVFAGFTNVTDRPTMLLGR